MNAQNIIVFVLILAFLCIAASVMAFLPTDIVADKMETELTEAQADLTQAEIDRLKEQTALKRAEGDLLIDQAVADLLSELKKDSQMIRRMLIWGSMRQLVFGIVLGWASLLSVEGVIFLVWRQHDQKNTETA